MHFRLFVADEYKPLRTVPPLMWLVTVALLASQILFTTYLLPPPEVRQTDYENPPSSSVLSLLALGEPATLAKLLVLRIQAFDNQPGVSVPFNELDYYKLGLWLDEAVLLDERAEYPHFLMSKIYASVKDETRQYQAVEWMWLQFLRDPNERWWWMAHTTSMVKNILKNDAMALEMARDLRNATDPEKIPGWARQMEAFFLDNQNEFDAAAAILQNQLESGDITDPQEFGFLVERLQGIIEKSFKNGTLTSKEEFDERISRIDDLHDKFLAQYEEKSKGAKEEERDKTKSKEKNTEEYTQ
ncbi:MAG: hypothetical protein K0U19_07845 [Proteobacteria bacterium]|nr:hypothetical protein [Pseudomonadota bacterium]